jgi:hypothetical protein
MEVSIEDQFSGNFLGKTPKKGEEKEQTQEYINISGELSRHHGAFPLVSERMSFDGSPFQDPGRF